MFVYSIIDQSTFDYLTFLLEQMLRVRDTDVVPMMVVGTKCDLSDQRVVTTEQGQALAAKFNAGFLECSSKTRINVNQIFHELAWRFLTGTYKNYYFSF